MIERFGHLCTMDTVLFIDILKFENHAGAQVNVYNASSISGG